MSDEYERLCARWDELTSARRVLTAREADELDSINTQLNAHDAAAAALIEKREPTEDEIAYGLQLEAELAARSEAMFINNWSMIAEDFDEIMRWGDHGGVEG